MDVIEMDAASTRGIDDIRQLRDRAHQVASEGRKKVYIVDEVHMLTREASNAMLKLLEEPPAHVIFVLATTEPHKILPTIVSRCQRFDFRRIAFEPMREHLMKVAKAEGISIDAEAISLLTRQSRGGLRDALSMLEQLSVYSDKRIDSRLVADMLGLGTYEEVYSLLSLLAGNDAPGIFQLVSDVVGRGTDLRQFIFQVLSCCRDIYLITQLAGSGKQAKGLIEASAEEQAVMMKIGERLGSRRMRRVMNMAEELERRLPMAIDAQVSIEVALISLLEEAPEKAPAQRTKAKAADVEEATVAAVSLADIEAGWARLTAELKSKSLSAYLLLAEARPVAARDGGVVLECSGAYHREQLQKAAAMKLLRQAIDAVFGAGLRVELITAQPSEGESVAVSAVDMLRDSFGAEVVNNNENPGGDVL